MGETITGTINLVMRRSARSSVRPSRCSRTGGARSEAGNARGRLTSSAGNESLGALPNSSLIAVLVSMPRKEGAVDVAGVDSDLGVFDRNQAGDACDAGRRRAHP